MKKLLSMTLVLLAMFCVIGLTSCDSADSEEPLYIYNSKGENAEQFAAMVADFTKESGIEAKAFSIGSGQDHMATLRQEMQNDGDKAPAVFSIQGAGELVEWRQAGSVLDLSTVTNTEFKALHDGVGQDLRLSTDGTNSYGIPYNVEGYGYMYDTTLLSALFGGSDVEADLIAATYEEFTAFGDALTAWIDTPMATKVTLNGTEYSMAATKTTETAKLQGVFSFAGAEKWTYGDHLLNTAISGAFTSSSSAQDATTAQIDASESAFRVYADALDYISSHAAGQVRGDDMITSIEGSYDKSADRFANHQALFLKQGNWAYDAVANVETVGQDVADNSSFIPVKMPWTADSLTNGKTVSEMNESISVFVPNYYAINKNVSEGMQEKAEEFLVWMNTSETGKDYILNEFNFIPYNEDPATSTLTNPLAKSILSYIGTGSTYPDAYHGLPSGVCGDTIGAEIKNNYLTQSTWTDANKDALAQYCVDQWKAALA